MTTPHPNALLAVIGTAGRQDDAKRINREIYDAMYVELLRAMADWKVRGLISGGAAVADHLAVRAYLEGEADRLVLHLPAPFQRGAFVRPPRAMSDDAGTANRYHHQFSRSCNLNSLLELQQAIERSAEVHVGNGFKARNLDVAAHSTHMLALTFGALREPVDILPDDDAFRDPAEAGLKDGGTAHTFSQAWRCDVKRHVSLNWLARNITLRASHQEDPAPSNLPDSTPF